MGLIGALINLDHYGHYLTWHWLNISVANLVVIVLMIAVFISALLLPFPGRAKRRSGK